MADPTRRTIDAAPKKAKTVALGATESACPACKSAAHVQLLRFQGETYYQCFAPKYREGEKERGQNPTGFCKFWSTKWKPEV